MPRKILAVALLMLATAGGAQTVGGPARHQLVSSGADGWKWYAVTDSRRVVASSPTRIYRFWMTGVNTNAVGARYAKVEVKYACAAQGWYVPTHVTLYDGARKVVSDTLTGDDPANWKAAEPGKPMDGVRPWACRA